LTSTRWALVAWLLALLWLGTFAFYGSPIPPAVLLALAAVGALTKFFADPRPRWALTAGALTAAASFFRHDIGVYTAVAFVVVLLAFWRRERGRTLRDGAGAYLGGLAIVGLPGWIAFAATVGLRAFVDQLLVFPLTVFPQARALAYPALLPTRDVGVSVADTITLASANFAFYLPFIVYAAAAIALWLWRRAQDANSPAFWGALSLWLIGLLFLNQARVQSTPSHLLPTLLPAAILFAVLCRRLWDSRAKLRLPALLALAAVGLFFIAQPLRAEAYLLKKT